MPIETQWLFEPSILVQRFVGQPSQNDIEDANQSISRFTFRNRQKTHLIADLSGLRALPAALHEIGDNMNHALSRSHVAWFVTIGSHDVALNFAAALMPHLTTVQHKHFHSQEEAFDFLSMMDASLPIF